MSYIKLTVTDVAKFILSDYQWHAVPLNLDNVGDQGINFLVQMKGQASVYLRLSLTLPEVQEVFVQGGRRFHMATKLETNAIDTTIDLPVNWDEVIPTPYVVLARMYLKLENQINDAVVACGDSQESFLFNIILEGPN